MGQSASARLIYGVNLGDCDQYEKGLPDWLVPHAGHTENDDDLRQAKIHLLEGSGIEKFEYGYLPNGLISIALGIQLAWAFDFGSDLVDLDKANVLIQEARPKIKEMLKKLGAPEDLILASFLITSYG